MTAKEAANMLGVAESTVQNATKYKNGTFLRLNGYSVYIPDDVDQNTSAFIYYPGAGGAWPNDASQLDKYIAGGNANQIIFITDISRDSRYMNGKYFMQEIERIGEANGVEITNVDCMGFSAGGPAVYSTLVSLASQSEEPGTDGPSGSARLHRITGRKDCKSRRENGRSQSPGRCPQYGYGRLQSAGGPGAGTARVRTDGRCACGSCLHF